MQSNPKAENEFREISLTEHSILILGDMGSSLKITDYLPHYTYDDYVHWEGRWEIIDGVAYSMSPQPNFNHQSISQNIAMLLGVALRGQKTYCAVLPIDWQIAEDRIVQPDNCVVRGRDHGVKLTETPVLVFEILSPSTATKDRGLKYKLYEEVGVLYYVIVDPDTKQADVFMLENGVYAKKFSGQTGKFDFVLEHFPFAFDFGEIW